MQFQALDNRLKIGPIPNHDRSHAAKFEIQQLSFWYGQKPALKDVSLDIFAHEVTALIGPSGCGKSTLLRCLNRMNEVVPNARLEGRILLDGGDIGDPRLDAIQLRRRVGWVAQRPNPFQRSIRGNILYGPTIHGVVSQPAEKDELVERVLRAVGLWDEVKDRLEESAFGMSIGQQQRLCIARAIAVGPDVVLMDEPCSALDPVATAHVEDLIDQLRRDYTLVVITHNLQQAARVAQRVAFFHLGEMLEAGDTDAVLMNPQHARCRAFISGTYG